MNIQPFESKDLLLLTAVQPADWPSVVPHFKYYTEASFCFPVKALIDGEIAGIGTIIVHGDLAWLSHIIVAPHYRNQGIGKQLTQSLIDSAYAQKCSTLLLIATDLGAPVYEKLGFETETSYVFYKDISLSFPADENILAFSSRYTEQILEMDKRVSGEHRKIQLEEHVSGAMVYIHKGMLKGYYLPDFGEGLIIAETPAAGTALMKTRLKTQDRASFPITNFAATGLFQLHGYTPFKTAKRMRLGIPRAWQPENLYNRIGGNLG